MGKLAPFLVLVIGTALSISVCLLLEKLEYEKVAQEVSSTSIVSMQSLKKDISNILGVSDSIRAFYDASSFVDRNEFKTFTKPLLDSNPDISAVAWVPKIKPERLDEYIQKAAEDGVENYTIRGVGKNDEWLPEYTSDEVYFPIYYIEPMEKTSSVLGLDEYSEERRRNALKKSVETNKKTATSLLNSVRDGKSLIQVIFNPVYKSSPSTSLQNAIREENILGFIAMAVRVQTLLENSFEQASNRFNFEVEDITDPNESYVILPFKREVKDTTFFYSDVVEVAGRIWKVKLIPDVIPSHAEHQFIPKIALGLGLFCTLVVALFVFQLIRRKEIVEKLVQEKTNELEKQRIQAIHASKLSVLGEMSAGVAHEINNPLTVIAGQSSLMEMMLEKGQTEGFDKRLGKINASVDRISSIVKGLKKFSRNSEVNEHAVHSIDRIILDAVEMTQHAMERHNIALDYEVDKDEQVFCNHVEIEQVFVNLIMNAKDAVRDNVESWIKIRATSEEGWVKIFVTDSGQGVPDEYIEDLFNPFFTNKNVGEGTGLGLSISHGIITEHGGKIYYNEDTLNTCFVVELKIHKE